MEFFNIIIMRMDGNRIINFLFYKKLLFYKMDEASKDVLFTIAMDLDLPSLLRWCQSSSRVNKHVCNNSSVWRNKLIRDYPDYEKFNLNKSLKETYVFMYQLSLIRKLLDTNESLYDIFLRKRLDLSRKGLKKVPALDLPNLHVLHLSNNSLTEVPAFDFPNLQVLELSNNSLSEVPTFNLPNLYILYLSHNSLTKVPAFDLPNLQTLYLDHNPLTEVPIFYLPNLQYLNLLNNSLTKQDKIRVAQIYGNKVSV